MAKQTTGRAHIGKIPDSPLQELPNFIEAGESVESVRENNVPTFIPIVRMDKPRLLRKIESEDLNELLPSKAMASHDKTVTIKDGRKGTDFSIQPEIDKIIDRENNIEKKAQGINIADNQNGSLTFTDYEGEKSIIPTGKKVQSTDETVEVVENASDFDLSIQKEIDNRKKADAELGLHLDAEIQRASNSESNLQNQIEQEARSRTAAINVERNRAIAKEDEIYTELELEIQRRQSEASSLQSQLNNETLTRESADANLQQQIDAFAGALIYIGKINLITPDVTQYALNSRANELRKVPILKGYVLVDNDANDWWYNGTEWVNIGYYEISQASNTQMGVVKGSTTDMKVSVDGLGEMSVNGLQNALDGKTPNSVSLTAPAAQAPTDTPAITDTVPNILQNIWNKLKAVYTFWSREITNPAGVMTWDSNPAMPGGTTLANLKAALGIDSKQNIYAETTNSVDLNTLHQTYPNGTILLKGTLSNSPLIAWAWCMISTSGSGTTLRVRQVLWKDDGATNAWIRIGTNNSGSMVWTQAKAALPNGTAAQFVKGDGSLESVLTFANGSSGSRTLLKSVGPDETSGDRYFFGINDTYKTIDITHVSGSGQGTGGGTVSVGRSEILLQSSIIGLQGSIKLRSISTESTLGTDKDGYIVALPRCSLGSADKSTGSFDKNRYYYYYRNPDSPNVVGNIDISTYSGFTTQDIGKIYTFCHITLKCQMYSQGTGAVATHTIQGHCSNVISVLLHDVVSGVGRFILYNYINGTPKSISTNEVPIWV